MNDKHLILKRGPTVSVQTYVGPMGEIVVDTDKTTLVVQDGVTPGGHPLEVFGTTYNRTFYQEFCPALSQNGTAFLTMAMGLSGNAPTAVSITGSNVVLGVASFAPLQEQSLQGHFSLPHDWIGGLSLDVVWRTTSLIGNVCWQIQTCGLDYAGAVSTNFNPPTKVYCPVGGLFNEVITNTITDIDMTEINSGDEVFFDFTRLDDTCAVAAEVVALRFSYVRNSV